MNTNEIIQLLGVIYFIFGLSFVFNRKYYKNIFKELFKSHIFLLLSGYLALSIGFIIITFYNEWTFTKEGLVTFLGWIAFIKGAFLLLFPHFMLKSMKYIINNKIFDLLIYFVTALGLILMYLGFIF